MVVASLAFVALVVAAVGVFFPTDLWRVEVSRDGLNLSLNDTAEDAGLPILFKDDFSDRSGKWKARDTATHRVEFSGGGLRILVRRDEDVVFQPRPLPFDAVAIRIEADATVLAGDANAILGILCQGSAGADASSTGIAYALLIHPQTLRTGIGRVSGALGEGGFELSHWLHQGTLATGRALGRTVHLRGDCSHAGGSSRRISFWVNGRRGGAATDVAGPARLTGAGFALLNAPGSAVPDVRFDDIVVTELNP